MLSLTEQPPSKISAKRLAEVRNDENQRPAIMSGRCKLQLGFKIDRKSTMIYGQPEKSALVLEKRDRKAEEDY